MVLGQRDSRTDAQLGRRQRGREVEGGGGECVSGIEGQRGRDRQQRNTETAGKWNGGNVRHRGTGALR
jgi:hypothetical protein